MPLKVLVIVGMHRSGTSLITNWLEKCGLHIGERLVAAAPSNIDGHFEDVEFKTIHEEALVSKNLPASGLVEEEAHHIDLSVYQKEKLKGIINVKNRLYEQWGWKDPRTCLFLNNYRQLLPGSKYLIIIRDYQSVINSLLKRDFADIDRAHLSRKWPSRVIWTYLRKSRNKERYYRNNTDHYLKVWMAYNEEILSAVKKMPPEDYLAVNYEVLVSKDAEVFNYLTSTWGFSLNYVDFKDIYKESLMSNAKSIAGYVKDKLLLTKADYIESRLHTLFRN